MKVIIMNNLAYCRLIKNEINKMPDFEFVEIEQNKHLKVRVKSLIDNRIFFATLAGSSSNANAAENSVQRTVKKTFESLRTYN